jgi:hypothetical protein
VETRFAEKLEAFAVAGEDGSEHPVEAPKISNETIPGEIIVSAEPKAEIHSTAEDQSPYPKTPSPAPRRRGVRIQEKPIRLRDKEHRKFVSMQPCLVCGRAPADPHHLRFAQPRAMSRKVSDEFTVPVCRLHHRELHTHGDEKLFWKKNNIDPLPIALRLWKQGPPDRSSIRPTLKTQISQNGLVNEGGGDREFTTDRADGGGTAS